MKRFSTILLISIASLHLNGQNLLTNNTVVALTDDVPFTIKGSTSNAGMVLNEGELRLSGNWANSGVYSSVSGTFQLDGANQVFEPGESTYSNLIINSSGIVITSDLQISQSLQLISGIVSLGNGAQVALGSDALISGGNENSYIDGVLNSSTQGDFTFPVGTESEYSPVTLYNIQSSDPVGIQAFSTQIGASISSGIDAISSNRYWQIIENPSFSADGIELPLLGENFIENDEEAVIGYSDELPSPLKILGVPTISGSLVSGSIRSNTNILSGYYVIADQSVEGPPIKVVNVITTLQDGLHDFLRIENIEFYEGNKVEIFNRSGTLVFEMSGYNNLDKVFRGMSNVGNAEPLATGSYYYTVQLSGKKRDAGFIYLKN